MALSSQPSPDGSIYPFSLRQLRGALLSVLLALTLTRKAASRAELERLTGYPAKRVNNALSHFFSLGIASHSSDGWFLNRKGREAAGYLFKGCFSPSPMNENQARPDTAIAMEKKPDEFQDLWEELRQAGIQRNERTEKLALLPHITPEYVRSHRRLLEERGKRGVRWSGLLITILESGEPAPHASQWQNPHPDDCRCLDCQILDEQNRRNDAAGEPDVVFEEAFEERGDLPQPDLSIELPATPRGESAQSAWESVVDQLALEIRRPAFEKWIRPAGLFAWDASAGIFIVCCSSDYVRDWLAQRMQSTIARALTGICARSVSVQFICPNDLPERR